MGPSPPTSVSDVSRSEFERQLRDMNEALLVSSVQQHELADLAHLSELRAIASGERLRFMAESMPQKIFTAAPDGNVDYFNRQWIDYSAMTFEQMRDWGWLQIIHPDDVKENIRRWEHCVATGEFFEIENRIRRHDGAYRWHLSRAHAMRDADGQVTMWIGSNTDIDDVKRTEIELRLAREVAEEANRAKDTFLATLSHELRTPLAAILGWAGLLRRPGCTPDDLTEGLTVIERNARAQAQLIEDVLDVSRIVSGKLSMNVHPCQLTAVIEAAIDVVHPAAQAKGIFINTRLDPAAGHVTCDASRMQQVFWNLVANAIKFTPVDGRVTVTLAADNSAATITVADNGQGIGADFLPYIFERFRQADGSSTRRFGGLGLGLSIVKHIVELHGGTVKVESKGAGQGSTFTVRIPTRAVAADASTGKEVGGIEKLPPVVALDAAPLAAVRLDGVRILIVDDEADARRLIAKVLQGAGARVTAVGTVRDALAELAKNLPQVLVSDLAMPDEDGFDLIREVRQLGYTPRQLPAVVLTALAKGHADSALLGGFQAHIVKPVETADLLAVVARLVGRDG